MISVIVPLTSDEKWWKRCISSLEQQGDQVEIICVHSSQSEETTKLKASDQISLVAAQGASFSELCAAGLEQAQGEFVAFVGTNGAGKSTTMRLMNGLLKPVTGEVLIAGVPTTELKTSELARRVGFLFQNPDSQICCNTVR